jgi:hypothetical protein
VYVVQGTVELPVRSVVLENTKRMHIMVSVCLNRHVLVPWQLSMKELQQLYEPVNARLDGGVWTQAVGNVMHGHTNRLLVMLMPVTSVVAESMQPPTVKVVKIALQVNFARLSLTKTVGPARLGNTAQRVAPPVHHVV